jgi:hypothetical protein
VAIFIRTDAPVAPGTATPSTAIKSTTSTSGLQLVQYYEYVYLQPYDTPGYYVDLATVSLNLTRRSVVVAVGVLLTAEAEVDNVIELRINIGDLDVGWVPLKSSPRSPYLVHGYRTLPPGSYTVSLRLVNFNTLSGYTATLYGILDVNNVKVVGYLVVYVVPLE